MRPRRTAQASAGAIAGQAGAGRGGLAALAGARAPVVTNQMMEQLRALQKLKASQKELTPQQNQQLATLSAQLQALQQFSNFARKLSGAKRPLTYDPKTVS